MKPIISSLIIVLFLNSCGPSDAYVNELIQIQNQAINELENQVLFKLNELRNLSDESPEKYEPAYKMLESVYGRFELQKEDQSISKTEYLQFQEFVLNIVEEKLVVPNFEMPPIPKDEFYSEDNDLQRASLLLSNAALTLRFGNIIFSDHEVSGWRFASLKDYEIGFDKDEYTFALLSYDVQHFANKNYQVDSVKFNGKLRHLQNKILPNVCSNITIGTDKEGEYEVYGHMNYTSYGRINSLSFQHFFAKKSNEK